MNKQKLDTLSFQQGQVRKNLEKKRTRTRTTCPVHIVLTIGTDTSVLNADEQHHKMKDVLASLSGESVFSGTMPLNLQRKFYPWKSQLRSLKIIFKKQLSPYCISNVIIHQPIFPIFFNLKCRQYLFLHTDYKPRLNKMGSI